MSIYPDRKNGELTGRFRVEVMVNGNRKRGRASSLPEAKQLEAALTESLKNGTSPALPNGGPMTRALRALTLGEAADRAKRHVWVGQATEMASLRKLDRVVELVGADCSLDDFDANTLDSVMAELRASGATDATVNRYLSNISAFLKFCFKRGFRTVPVPELDWRDEGEGRIRWVSYDEEAELMELLPEPFATVVYVAIRTGMRAMELLSLDADQLEQRWVHLWETKNGSARSVPLNADLHGRLEPLVSEGLMPDYWQLRYEWDKARKAMGLADDPLFVFHACRHTFATRAVQAGVNLRVLQKLMGHKTIQTTLRYAHVNDETLAEAAMKALDFHAEKLSEAGQSGGAIPALRRRSAAQRGASSNRRPDGGVVTQRTANPLKDP